MIAGRSVNEVSTARATTTMAAIARLVKMTFWTRNMPAIARSTVTPAKKTAFPEVAQAACSASSFELPRPRSAR